VRGIVHANSLARLLHDRGRRRHVRDAIRDAPIVPETKPLDDLLADLQRTRSSMAASSTSTAASRAS
jgi:CBS domain containing-hemolysin-like protein